MKIGIMGAGAIGCYLGGKLIAKGHDVVMVGRSSLAGEIAEHGLHLTDYTGETIDLEPNQVAYVTDPSRLGDRDAIFLTVKNPATVDAGEQIKPHLPAHAPVISFQNGVRNAALLREVLPDAKVLAGMVPFNVVRSEGARFHLGTSGPLVMEKTNAGEDRAAAALVEAGFEAQVLENLPGILWTKLLMNMSNAVNALVGVPLREGLGNRDYRRVVAACIREGLRALDAAGIKPVRYGRMLPRIAPGVLGLPDWLFFRVAAAMVKIDPEARSSMWEDLQRGRETEIDYLNGEIIALGEKHAVPTPVNRRIFDMIKQAEEAKSGSPKISPAELLKKTMNTDT